MLCILCGEKFFAFFSWKENKLTCFFSAGLIQLIEFVSMEMLRKYLFWSELTCRNLSEQQLKLLFLSFFPPLLFFKQMTTNIFHFFCLRTNTERVTVIFTTASECAEISVSPVINCALSSLYRYQFHSMNKIRFFIKSFFSYLLAHISTLRYTGPLKDEF